MIHIKHNHLVKIDANVSYGYSDDEATKGVYQSRDEIINTVITTGDAIVVTNSDREQDYLNITDGRKSRKRNISLICVPIKMTDNTIGTISVELFNDNYDLSEKLQILTTLSVMIAYAVNNHLEIQQKKNELRAEDIILNNLSFSKEIADNNSKNPKNLEDITNLFLKNIIISQLKKTKGNITKAALQLGTTKRILNYKIKQLNIDYIKYRTKYRGK